MKIFLTTTLVFLFGTSAGLARSFDRKPVPLLPEMTDGSSSASRSLNVIRGRRRSASVSPSSEYQTQNGPPLLYGIGFDLGVITVPSNSNSGALGLQWLYGGRATARLRVMPSFYVVPSIGYFRRSDGVAAVSVTQNTIELGVSGFWTPNPHRNSIFLLGAAYRFDVILNRIQALQIGDTTTVTRSRIGPAAQFSTKLSQDLVGLLNLEATMPFVSPVKLYPALHLGVIFKL